MTLPLARGAAAHSAMLDPRSINFAWLLRLRGWAMGGQLTLALLADRIAGIDLPLTALAGIVLVEALSNLWFARWAARGNVPENRLLGALMAFDVALFTLLLQLTGGPLNPFSFLYLVYIALAAVVLPAGWGWMLAGFSLACFGLLFLLEGGGSAEHHAHHMQLHLEGMWLAFAVAAAFIVYFVQRVTRALALREAELQEARALTARHERLASLATLAAGAAHQLATPLSTIAVVARELADQLAARAGDDDAVADAQLIRDQVERCRQILLHMATDAGESTGEALADIAVDRLVAGAVDGLADAARVRLRVASDVDALHLTTPVRSVTQALRAVIKNALEASPPTTAVVVEVRGNAQALEIVVRDDGPGMAADVLRHVGEPFFTTKGPDRGMGLGLFLTRSVLEGLGGDLGLRSAPGIGTEVILTIPRRLAPTAATNDRMVGDSQSAA
jgi:two-component system sensor histidine kinase RegB